MKSDLFPKYSDIEIDVNRTRVPDYDILEILDEFAIKAKSRIFTIKLIFLKGEVENPESYRRYFGLDPAV